jgi:hypothetical protein
VPLRLQVSADAGGGRSGRASEKIEITVQAADDPGIVRREASSFIFPH